MEEMQTPQESEAQKTPAANTGPVPEVTPEKKPSPKKKGGFMKILIVVLILAIAGGAAALYFLGGQEDQPPSLKMSGAKFQGQSIGESIGALVYEQSDVDNFDEPSNAQWTSLPKGVNHIYAKNDITVEELVNNHIRPQEDLRIFVADYKPQDSQFYLYPTNGPYAAEEIEDGSAYEIPAGKAFSILASDEFEINSNVINDSDTFSVSNYLNDYIGQEPGWYLLGLPENYVDISDQVEVSGFWVQTGQNSFDKVTDLSSPDLSKSIAWYKLGDTVTPAAETEDTTQDTTQDTEVAECGNNEIEGDEVCDGTALGGKTCEDVGDYTGGTLACNNDCSGFDESACEEPEPEPVCGNGEVEEGEECDDGNTTDGDGCSAECLIEEQGAVCGNNEREWGEACDGTDLNNNTCSSLGYDGGELSCEPDCSGYDTSSCTTDTTTDSSTSSTSTTTATSPSSSLIGSQDSILSEEQQDILSEGAPERSGVLKLSNIEYINNISNEFTDGEDMYAQLEEQLFIPEGASDHLDPPVQYQREDNQGGGNEKKIMTAVKVEIDPLEGAEISAYLNSLYYRTEGYKRIGIDIEEYATSQDDGFCIGSEPAELWKIAPASNETGYTNELVARDDDQDFIFEAVNSSSDYFNEGAAKIIPGNWAVYYLIETDIHNCSPDSPGFGIENPSSNTTSRSFTNFVDIEFTDDNGNPLLGPSGETKQAFQNTDIDYYDFGRWTYWN